MEHASLLNEDDVFRLASMGVTASVQPAFLTSETTWLAKRLGSERMEMAYPFRSMAEAGIPLAGGSDCPVEPPHPLLGMAAAQDRAGIVRDQGLNAAQALELFTKGAARAMHESEPLEVGSPADVVVLDRDPLQEGAAALRRTLVKATYVGGRRVPFEEATLDTWTT